MAATESPGNTTPAQRRRRLPCPAAGFLLGLLAAAGCCPPAAAAVLPEERADALYHSYDGGGVEITGPSVLVRKNIGDKVSVAANYYVDMITSASIDVVTQASAYSEERTQISLAADYVHEKTLMGIGYTRSEESDYSAQTLALGISQDFFGDLSTLSLGYAIGQDEVRNNGDPEFSEPVDRRSFTLSFTQVLTRNWVLGLVAEAIVDEGYLNNPYRSVRYRDDSSDLGYAYQPEVYPNTRNSDAVALRSLYYLPYRAALRGNYRYFSDSWGVRASDIELRYLHPLPNGLSFEGRYRYYTQTAADFYSDLFPYQDAQNYLGRDKELSTFHSSTFGLGLSYLFPFSGAKYLERSSVNLYWDYIMFDYEDFRDVREGGPVGGEPLYRFNANVVRLFFSLWY